MRSVIGRDGEAYCASRLEELGWRVENSNHLRANAPNVDLVITKGSKIKRVQVKSSKRERGYITGGSVNPKVVNGSPIFNRVEDEVFADFVIFISKLYTSPNCFVVPVSAAEAIFRKNIDAYFKSPKLNGGEKSLYGQCDIFMGIDPFPHARIVPDQRQELEPFKDAWGVLER